jgi:hypothetical protein
MLKRTIGLLITFALIQSFACVIPTQAVSATVLITHIQPGVSGGATKEFVAIYNNTASEIDVTDWCLQNKAKVSFACITETNDGEQAWLPAYNYATFLSKSYAEVSLNTITPSVVYVSTNQSSGAIVGSADSISLIDAKKRLVDTHFWNIGLTNGALFIRKVAADSPTVYQNIVAAEDWSSGVLNSDISLHPSDQIKWRILEPVDLCANIEDMQLAIPSGMEVVDGICEELPPVIVPTISITEILPNPAGADAGNEFIELYNYGSNAIDLTGYRIYYGSNTDKFFTLSTLIIAANSYVAITHDDAVFTLPNTTGSVRLETADGLVVDEVLAYSNAKDDQAWALFADGWRYTKVPTPGDDNTEILILPSATTSPDQTKPCAITQYRHPETGRCRLIVTTTNVQTECKQNQYRSSETGRCRNVATATVPTACKVGQERNPETNRCRNSKSLAATDYGVLKAKQVKQADHTYIYAAIFAVIAAVLVYALWEWRIEIKQAMKRVRWPVLRP